MLQELKLNIKYKNPNPNKPANYLQALNFSSTWAGCQNGNFTRGDRVKI